MKKQLWLATFACALFSVTAQFQPLVAQDATPDIRAAQPDGKNAKYIVFDGPEEGITCFEYCGTPIGIDTVGTVFGDWQKKSETLGFYRLTDGSIHNLQIDVPGCASENECARPIAVAPNGTLAGQYIVGGKAYSFLRDRAGNYTKIHAFDSETYTAAINSNGMITGTYSFDPIGHGFVRDAEGNYTSFDLPDEGDLEFTMPTAINSLGDIVGVSSYDNQNQPVPFLRDHNGNMTVLANGQWNSITPVAIGDDGRIVGWYEDASLNHFGFIRDAQGNYESFSVSGAKYTLPVAVDPQGSIIGWTPNRPPNAFYLLKDGTFGYISPPGAAVTVPVGINSKGDITGYFYDAGVHLHNFIRINPDPPPPSTTQDGNTGEKPAQ